MFKINPLDLAQYIDEKYQYILENYLEYILKNTSLKFFEGTSNELYGLKALNIEHYCPKLEFKIICDLKKCKKIISDKQSFKEDLLKTIVENNYYDFNDDITLIEMISLFEKFQGYCFVINTNNDSINLEEINNKKYNLNNIIWITPKNSKKILKENLYKILSKELKELNAYLHQEKFQVYTWQSKDWQFINNQYVVNTNFQFNPEIISFKDIEKKIQIAK